VRFGTAVAVCPRLLEASSRRGRCLSRAALVALPATSKAAAAPAGRSSLQVHLDRARRREEPVHVLNLRLGAPGRITPELVSEPVPAERQRLAAERGATCSPC
jgi:hypothetical protein